MDTLKNLFCLCFRILVRLVFYALVFIVLAWLLLGLTPTQTVQTSMKNIINIVYGTKSFTRSLSQTAGSMGDVARHHLNEAAERVDGKDPYAGFNAGLDAQVQGTISR